MSFYYISQMESYCLQPMSIGAVARLVLIQGRHLFPKSLTTIEVNHL